MSLAHFCCPWCSLLLTFAFFQPFRLGPGGKELHTSIPVVVVPRRTLYSVSFFDISLEVQYGGINISNITQSKGKRTKMLVRFSVFSNSGVITLFQMLLCCRFLTLVESEHFKRDYTASSSAMSRFACGVWCYFVLLGFEKMTRISMRKYLNRFSLRILLY